jgi:uracil phosphoribosyltransferase
LTIALLDELVEAIRKVLNPSQGNLHKKGYILPGLGDAGDRIYGTKLS